MAGRFPTGRHVILGTAEKDGNIFLVMDLSEKTAQGRSYMSGAIRRYIDIIPADFYDYESYKAVCRKKIGEIKKRRRTGRKNAVYTFMNGEEINISVKEDVAENFLGTKMSRFVDTVLSNARPAPNFHGAVTEESIRKFFSRDREAIIKDLKKIQEGLYSHDSKWRKYLSDNGISLAVIMPTYNESNLRRNIQLVGNVRKAGLLEEIIITDGYSVRHEPSDVLRSLESTGNKIDCTIIRQNGAGKGEAIESAVKYAFAEGHDFCIILDSDNMPALSRIMPDIPVDIDIEFFVRNFIKSIIGHAQENGLAKAKKTFFKASYMRIPQLKKSFDLRFGIVTKMVKDFYSRALGSEHNLYPLSGEVAFNPQFLLEKLSLTRELLEMSGMKASQYCGSNVPGGFCLETVWNSIIDIMGYDIRYVNMYLHHHGPVIKSTKTDIEEQLGEVLTGTFAGMLAGLIYAGKGQDAAVRMLRHIPLDVWRADRLILNLTGGKIKSSDIL